MKMRMLFPMLLVLVAACAAVLPTDARAQQPLYYYISPPQTVTYPSDLRIYQPSQYWIYYGDSWSWTPQSGRTYTYAPQWLPLVPAYSQPLIPLTYGSYYVW